MDFLKKAKAQLAEVQGDLSKATASLGLGEKKEEPTSPSSSVAQPQSSNSTPINTPATSVAPSTAGAPKAKLPLAIRKNGMYTALITTSCNAPCADCGLFQFAMYGRLRNLTWKRRSRSCLALLGKRISTLHMSTPSPKNVTQKIIRVT